jgi:hypothetical protein
MNSFKYFYFLTEGGAAGHMLHPFDLPQVINGNALIKVFKQTEASVREKPAAVKIDGLNASIKLITNADGSKEFALDRGSNKQEDIQGVTLSTLPNRFPQGHGMLAVGTDVLSIFNKALPTITNELKRLKMLDNSNILFNMEYVKGSTNVIGYKDNFLAIHGLNEMYQVTSPVKKSISRASREISYDRKALADLIEKVNKIARSFDFNVVGEIAAALPRNISFEPELNSEFAVKYNSEHAEVKTLRTWLQKAKNPKGITVTLTNGKRVDALSKQIYLAVLEGQELESLIKNGDSKDIKNAIDGAVIYHATRLLGQKLLSSMKSPLGDIETQEGIVIRDPKISTAPFKITGEFIVRGMQSKFKKNEQEEGPLTRSALNNINYINTPPYEYEGSNLRSTPGFNINPT